MSKMTITTARGTQIELAANHNLGTIEATLPNGAVHTVWLGEHPQHGPVLSSQSAGVQFAALNIVLPAAIVPQVKAFAAAVREVSNADPNTYVGAHAAYDANYARVCRAMEG